MSSRLRKSLLAAIAVVSAAATVAAAEPLDVWSRIDIPGETARIQAVAVAADGTIYVGTDRHGVYRTRDGLTWTAGAGAIATANVFSMTVDLLNPARVFAATLGGMFRSTDGGATWFSADEGLMGNAVLAVAIAPGPGGPVYAGTDTGLFRSSDSGMSWTKAWSTLTADGVSAITIAPTAPSVIYIGTFAFGRPGPAPVGSGVFRSSDGGLSWSAVNSGLGGSAVFSVTVAPTDPATVLAAVEGGLYRTSSGGASWTRVLAASIGAVTFDPTQNATVYAGGTDVFRSVDAGASWSITDSGLVSPTSPAAGVLSLAIDRSRRVYAGTAVKGLFRGTFAHAGNCSEDASTLCLASGRFQVTTEWKVPSQGTAGSGQAMSLSVDAGAFWFFSPNNIELVVKVVDGRAFNNRFWVFGGALSDVAYTITVRDTLSGLTKSYTNPQGTLTSFADTNAF